MPEIELYDIEEEQAHRNIKKTLLKNEVTHLNTKDRVPIFSLSFGTFGDKNFLRKFSLRNLGFSRHIYEAADASLQLQDFYRQISSPLLHDIKFKYDAAVEAVTRTWFPIYFRGSELVVAGKYGESTFPTTVNCCGPRGPIIIKSAMERPINSLERLWAYLTVKQLLDDRESSTNSVELTKKAVDLALKYSFVTEVTSLVVVKPNETTVPMDNSSPTMSSSSRSPRKMLCCKSALRHRKVCPVPSATCDNIEILEQETEKPAKFIADRPFLVILQLKKDDTVLVLFRGHVYRPIY